MRIANINIKEISIDHNARTIFIGRTCNSCRNRTIILASDGNRSSLRNCAAISIINKIAIFDNFALTHREGCVKISVDTEAITNDHYAAIITTNQCEACHI